MSSNVSQSYPAGSEPEHRRAAAVAAALAANEGLAATLAEMALPLPEPVPADHGAPPAWWIWVCPNPRDEARGRLHVAGYARERHALVTVCDTCGRTYLR